MADKAVSDLTEATTSAGADLLLIETSGGNSRKVKVGKAGTGFGTSFPSSPSDGDRFWRSDLGLEFFYKSSVSRWLTTQVFTVEMQINAAFSATTVNQNRTPLYKHGLSDVYVERIELAYILVGTGNWTVTYNYSGSSSGTLGSGHTVSTTVSGNHYTASSSVGSLITGLADIDFSLTENSGTADFYPMPSVGYRLAG